MTAVYVAIAVVVVLVLGTALVYNGVIRARNMVADAWSGVDVQLKRRHDLIPNLVAAVKGYAVHESQLFEHAAVARTAAEAAGGAAAATPAESDVNAATRELFAVAEQYPDLKASENFLQLQSQLTDVENEISAARAIYNGNVESYNSRIQSFPAVLLKAAFGWRTAEFFAAGDADRVVPEVTPA